MGFIQADVGTWAALLKQHGPYLVFSIMSVLFIWKVMWPAREQQIEKYQARLENEIEASRQALQQSMQAQSKMTEQFTAALKERDDVQREIAKGVEMALNELREVRRARRETK